MASNCVLEYGQRPVMFSHVRYRAIDYSCEASARHRLLMNLLMLPVPIQLDRNIYPHSGHVEKTYRTPWTHGNFRTMYRLDLTGSALDYLKAELRCPGDSLERFDLGVTELGEVVPSSNPASQDSVRSEEALWLQRGERTAGHPEWRDNFSPADINSSCFSYQDLFLPEEMIMSDHLKLFRSWLPPLQTFVRRLQILTVADPLLHHSRVFFFGSHCEPYDVPCDEPASSLEAEPGVEVFTKESILTAESLMLPVGIEQAVVQKKDIMLSITGLHETLNITPEPAEEQNSVLDALRKVTPAGVLSPPECERLDVPVPDSNVTNRTTSPVPYKSYVEMETDLVLSPPNRAVLPKLFLSTSQLTSEPLSPVNKQVLLSDDDRKVMEKGVWMAEKYPHCVAQFLLAEPQIPSSARGPSLPELWSLLEAEREPLNTDSPTDSQRQSTFTLLAQKATQWTCTEPMTLEKPAAPDKEEDAIEQFSLLSVVQIDDLLMNSTERAVQDAPSSVKDVSPHSITSVTPVPSRVGAGKAVKFILLEEAPQKQSTTSKSKDTAGQPMAVNKCPLKDFQSEELPGTVSGTNQFNDHLSENTLKEDGGHVTATSIQASHRPSEEHQETPSKTLNSLDSPGDLHVAQVTPVEQKLDDGLISTVSVSPAQSVHQVGESVTRPAAFKSNQRSFSVFEPLEDFDPLSSFVMLRTSQRSPVVQKPQQIPLHTPVPDSAQRCTRKPIPCSDLLEASKKAKNSEASLRITEKAFSKTIYVQATEAERFAYFELHALAQSSLSRVRESDPNALRRKDFASLTSEDARFSLKQQERLLSVGQGRDGVYNDVALLHILVRAKEVLLKCDFNTAIGYLEEAQSTCTMGGLKELLRRLQVLQYLNHRNNEEHRPRVLHLQEQTNTYLQRNISNTVLVITATECVRAELVTALSQVPGSSVSAVVPDKDKSKVDSRAVLDSLACSRSLVVCSQQVGADFPWQRFTVVLEFDNLCHSTLSSFCSQNNVNYICFCTETPDTDLAVSPQAYLDSMPFLLFISEGLLKSSDLLQLLESKYNMTFLDRSYSQSLQRLGATDVITVDEKTAILLQEMEELQLEQASESVVIRLSALSLQFTRCWIILHFNEQHSKLVHGDVFRNLVLIYSSFVLFGLKSEDLEIKVLLVCDVADIAWYVHQICLHTLLSSERSVWSWFDRDWFSVVETEEEKCLVCFPCVNSVVAQLMLRRAPSLQWLLEASFSDLKESFPEFPNKICKLFSEITALHRLTAAPSLSETEIAAPLPCNDMLHPPHPQLPHQTVDGDQPHSDSLTHTQLFLQHSSTEPDSPGLVQQQGIVDRGWLGAVSGGPVTPSECVYDSESWPGEHTQDGRYTGPFGGGEEDWTVDASSLSAPDLSLSHKHPAHFELPAPAVLFSQDAPVEEMKVQQWRSSVCGTSSRGQQSDIYSILSQYQRGPERKRPAREGAGETGFPECKRGKLLFERVPGRCDGQTRLRFF